MRVIVAAAGHQKKWGNYLGVPSHLAPVNGEPLLARTLRQALTISDDVVVTYPGDDRYLKAVPIGVAAHERSIDLPSEYRATRDLWSTTDRTVLLLGDCYFTDDAIQTIGNFWDCKFQGFGRHGASKITGCRYGEMFAASWWPQHHAAMDGHLAVIEKHHADGTITRPTGWMLLRAWQGTPLNKHRTDPRWMTTIDDETEDWDFPVDYDQHPVNRRVTESKAAGKGHGVRKRDFGKLLHDLGIPARHVVHVGAHEGEEVPDYEAAGFGMITLVEPLPHLAADLRRRFPDAAVVQAACAAEPGVGKLNLMSKTNMATLVTPGTADRSNGSVEVPVTTLKDIAWAANVAVIDAQGLELDVLKGAELERYDLVVVETCTVPDATMASGFDEVTQHMRAHGFEIHEYWVRDYQWMVKWARGQRAETPGEVRDVVYIRSSDGGSGGPVSNG